VAGVEILTTFELAAVLEALGSGAIEAAVAQVKVDVEPYMETVEGEGIDDEELAAYLDPLGALVEPSHAFGTDMASYVTWLEGS